MAWRKKVEIEPGFCILWAFLILTLPVKFLMAAICAAIVHEVCHAGAVRLMGGHIRALTLGAGGMLMEASSLTRKEELFCVLAGPAGSFLLACLPFPVLTLCGMFQGLFNLLPIMPLDGGRALGCILDITAPRYRQKIERGVAIAVYTLLLTIAVHLDPGAVILWLVLVFRKFPCKPWGKRVQ